MEWYKLDGSGNGGMTHDGAGRVTAEFGRTYTYDDFHSLVRAGAASGSNAQGFQYDAAGRLIAVRRGTAGWPVEEELAYDGTQMVAAWNGAGVATWSAVWGQGVDNLISVKPGVDGAEVMALKDGRGSVVGYYQAEATPQGLLATADYTPEGRVTSKDWVTGTTCTETGSTQCPRLGGLPFGFHGAYKSPAHGLLYFRNRWYSAEAGQWLTQDPLGEVDSVNLYAFNRFDSVNFIDPFGLEGQGAAVTASNDGAIANDHVPVNDVNWECAASGQNCPKTPPRTPLKPAPASGAAAGPAAKADDEVDARGYMREEAKNDRRNAGRGGMVADAVVQSMLSQVKQPQRKRVVLVLMGKKIDSADKKSEFYRKHMGSVIKNFEAKVLDAIVHINIANSVERKGLMGEDLQITQTGDVIVSVPYDGTAPKLPPGVTASDVGEVVYFGHGAYNAPKILPAGDGTKGVTPKEFAGQLSSMGLGDVERVVILGCEAQENGFADGLKSEMPGSDVWGATGFVQPNYETDAKGRALPDSSIFLDSEIYHAK